VEKLEHTFTITIMKFSCRTAELLQTLQLASRAISGQQALPILNNVLIEIEGKHCTVSATDLELSIVTSFEADVENEGAITVPAKAILNFAQYNPTEEVLLETSEGTQLKCTSKHGKTVIAGESANEYPTISPIEKDTSFNIGMEPLLSALHKITFACARSSVRPVLSGVYIRVNKGKLTFVATDSYRLSEYTTSGEIDADDVSCIVPVKVLEELRTVLAAYRGIKSSGDEEDGKKESGKKKVKKEDEAESVSVSLSSQQIELHVGTTKLLSRLIEGKFPDYQQIIPKGEGTTVELSTKELTTVVKRMHYFAKEINNNLTFSLGKNDLKIATPQTQAGKDEATLSTETKGPANKIALSSAYILDFLTHTDGDTIQLKVTDSMHPAVFRIIGEESYLHLIMPLRLQEDAK